MTAQKISSDQPLLRQINIEDLPSLRRSPVERRILLAAEQIVERVATEGETALRELAEQFGDRAPGDPLIIEHAALEAATKALPPADRNALVDAAARIECFARAQRNSIGNLTMKVETGGELRQEVIPIERAGCYAPGGRYPLPSSVLMTVIPARVAGVSDITLASPHPTNIMLAAAGIAGADRVLAVGGAHAIAALAYGVAVKPVDVIVGPGNCWVTAAKKIVAGYIRVDMLAGPSELVIIADDSANPAIIAADLLAQAEHDSAALPILITTSPPLTNAVNQELLAQLENLPTAETARQALANGFVLVAKSTAQAAQYADQLAPEHLQIVTRDAAALAAQIRHAGALFIGEQSAEVFGDYGIGPNHTLPTGGTARSLAGLSVFDFLRIRSSMELSGNAHPAFLKSIAHLARLEGLEAHARAAEMRFRLS